MIIAGAMLFSSNANSSLATPTTTVEHINNVSMSDGKQIIEVSVKGGYTPKNSLAKMGIPTILRFKTNGTYDCSSSLRIPSMSINKTLPASGTTDLDLGTPQVATLDGVCGMGMYSFHIDFQG